MELPYPLIIDGGLSNELEILGCDLNHPLWTAKCISETPEKVIQVHHNYLKSGSDCIATMSYQASIEGLMKYDFSHAESHEIIKNSVYLAEEARQRFYDTTEPTKRAYIAASIGPYGAYLADGSEYQGDYGVSKADLKAFHQERFDIFSESGADLLACETFPDFEELEVINDLIRNGSKPAWVSFSCKNSQQLADGTPLTKCAELFQSNLNVIAIGANCIAMEWVPKVITTLKQTTDKRIVVYPNGGGYFDSDAKEWKNPKTGLVFEDEAKKWLDLGASIIGGCCRIGCADISCLSQSLNSQ